MSAGDLTRRKVLALLGAGGLGLLAVGGGLEAEGQLPAAGPSTPPPAPATDRSNLPSPPGGNQRTSPEDVSTPGDAEISDRTEVFDVRDFGAAVDGTTDDTGALMRAVRAASPDGTVQLPAGELLVGSRGRNRVHALGLGANQRDVTVRGAGPDLTRLVMAPGHRQRHVGLLLRSPAGQPLGQVVFENLTFDGDKPNQLGDGKAIQTEAAGGRLVLRNCRVTSWHNAGLKLEGTLDAAISYCHFDNNGLRENGGHAISVNQRGRTVIRWSLVEDSGGVDIDVGLKNNADLQTVLIERCVLRNSRGSLKVNSENKQTTVRHVQLLGDDGTTIPIKENPTNIPIGDIHLDNVLIDGGGWPGIDIPAPGSISGDMVAIKNVATTREEVDNRNAAVYTERLRWNSFGKLSVENVGPNGTGVALNINGGAGSIREVILADGVTGVGNAEGVSIGRATGGDSLTPDVPDVSEVGPRRFRF